jgi:hypothetical protein
MLATDFYNRFESACRPWDSLSMDFIIGLPESDGCSSVWVIVNRFTKMVHFIPLKDAEKKVTDLVRIFLKKVWRFLGLPSNIASDWDSRFACTFWSSLAEALDIKVKITSPFHPHTDGQTEKVNQTLECYFRNYCNYKQDTWSEILLMAEYVYNNSVITAMGMSIFFPNFGLHPRTNWPFYAQAKNLAFRNVIHWMKSVHTV